MHTTHYTLVHHHLLRTTKATTTQRSHTQSTRAFSLSNSNSKPFFQSKRYSPTIVSDTGDPKKSKNQADASSIPPILVRAGFIRQSANGIWSFLPNGLRVLNKIEAIVRSEIEQTGATEISMPLLQTQKLWEQSGRWTEAGPELFRLSDRKGSKLLLSPTHEEEITNLVKSDVRSSKQLPIKLFHIGRKFRDELRPRAGLLRSREFIMKDLYTFDVDSTSAMKSYQDVQNAYRRIFESIGIPFLMAEADSGNIGGAKSHEYHFKSSSGEDTLIHCTSCAYTANLELARSTLSPSIDDTSKIKVYFYSIPNTRIFLAAVVPMYHKIHPLKLSKVYPDARPVVMADKARPKFDEEWDRMEVLIDQSCTMLDLESLFDRITHQFRQTFGGVVDQSMCSDEHSEDQQVIKNKNRLSLELSPLSIWPGLPTYTIHDIRTVLTGQSSRTDHPESAERLIQELCPDCSSPLDSSSAIEVGHTFYLGTKYSNALKATFSIADPDTGKQTTRAYEMGCFGIGISRLLGAIAECIHTTSQGSKAGGLRWPINVAPFKVCIILPPSESKANKDGQISQLAKQLACLLENHVVGLADDVLIDDRDHKIGWKLADADLVGYPLLIIVGNQWTDNQVVQLKNQISDQMFSISIAPQSSSSSPDQSFFTGFDSQNFIPIRNQILLELGQKMK